MVIVVEVFVIVLDQDLPEKAEHSGERGRERTLYTQSLFLKSFSLCLMYKSLSWKFLSLVYNSLSLKSLLLSWCTEFFSF